MDALERIKSLDPKDVVAYCTDINVPVDKAYSKLMSIISDAAEISEKINESEMQEILNKLKIIGRGLRQNAAIYGSMKFYYYGQFAADLENRIGGDHVREV